MGAPLAHLRLRALAHHLEGVDRVRVLLAHLEHLAEGAGAELLHVVEVVHGGHLLLARLELLHARVVLGGDELGEGVRAQLLEGLGRRLVEELGPHERGRAVRVGGRVDGGGTRGDGLGGQGHRALPARLHELRVHQARLLVGGHAARHRAELLHLLPEGSHRQLGRSRR